MKHEDVVAGCEDFCDGCDNRHVEGDEDFCYWVCDDEDCPELGQATDE